MLAGWRLSVLSWAECRIYSICPVCGFAGWQRVFDSKKVTCRHVCRKRWGCTTGNYHLASWTSWATCWESVKNVTIWHTCRVGATSDEQKTHVVLGSMRSFCHMWCGVSWSLTPVCKTCDDDEVALLKVWHPLPKFYKIERKTVNPVLSLRERSHSWEGGCSLSTPAYILRLETIL